MRSHSYSLLLLFCFSLLGCPTNNSGEQTNTGDNRPVGMTLVTFRYLAQDAEVIQAFEDRMHFRVNVIVKPVSEIIAPAVAGKPIEGDVVILPSIEDAVRLRGFNVLQPFFVNSFTNGDVSDAFIDNEGYYSGLTRWTMATVYNPNAVTEEEGSTYRGILEAPLRGIRLGVAHPDSSGLAGVIAGLNAAVSPAAADLWTQAVYQKSSGGLHGNDYQQLDRMLAGELDMALVSSGSLMRWFLNGDKRHYEAGSVWRIKLPQTQAGGDNFMNMTCLTMPAETPNRNTAMAFIDYLYEKEVQTILTNAYFEYPTQSFTESSDYLYGIRDNIGRKPSAEDLENNLPTAWALINREAEKL